MGGGWGVRVATEDELEAALARARSGNAAGDGGPALIEVVLERDDTTEALKRLGAALSPDRT